MTLLEALVAQGYSREEAKETLRYMKRSVAEILENGGSLDEVEEVLYEEGLEPDYTFELLS